MRGRASGHGGSFLPSFFPSFLTCSSLLASWFTVLDAGLPLKYMFGAVSVGLSSADSPTPVLDLTSAEEHTVTCPTTFAFQGVVSDKGVATAAPDGMLLMQSSGTVPAPHFDALLDAGAAGCSTVLAFLSGARHEATKSAIPS